MISPRFRGEHAHRFGAAPRFRRACSGEDRGQRRDDPLLPPLATELRALRQRGAAVNVTRLAPDALVFTTAQGKPQSRRNLLRAVHAAGDAAALNGEGRERVGVHDLRHSFVAVALASGMTLAEAAVLARHASPLVTATVYAGLTVNSRAALGTKLAAAFHA